MIATAAQIARHQRDLTAMAKEPVTVEQVSDTMYAFGSEIAILRIFAKYNGNGATPTSKVRIGYSQNLQTFFFSIDL